MSEAFSISFLELYMSEDFSIFFNKKRQVFFRETYMSEAFSISFPKTDMSEAFSICFRKTGMSEVFWKRGDIFSIVGILHRFEKYIFEYLSVAFSKKRDFLEKST